MRGPDDSRLTKQTDPAIRTPRYTLTEAEFRQYRAKCDEIFQKTEDDFAQQDANEAMSGPGRSHFHPADRPTQPIPVVKPHSSGETQTVYPPYERQNTLSACWDAIRIHQSMCRTDPQQIRMLDTRYFDLSDETLKTYHTPFRGKLAFVSLSGKAKEIDVSVHGKSTDIVICVH